MNEHTEHIAELRAELESAKADLCSHGVPRSNCSDHNGESREADHAE